MKKKTPSQDNDCRLQTNDFSYLYRHILPDLVSSAHICQAPIDRLDSLELRLLST